MNKLAIEIGKRIRKERSEHNLSQEALAHACCIDRSYMGRIERGEVSITVEKLYAIANKLNCEPYTLLPKQREAITWSSAIDS